MQKGTQGEAVVPRPTPNCKATSLSSGIAQVDSAIARGFLAAPFKHLRLRIAGGLVLEWHRKLRDTAY